MADKKLLIAGSILIFIGFSGIGGAQSESSANYRLDESYIGPGGTVNSTSASYSESSTVGDLATGNSSSTNYQTNAGFNTTADPRLVVSVNTSSVGFGGVSSNTTATATSSFSVLNYTSSGYAVFTVGNPPTNGSHTLCGMSAAGCTSSSSQAGVEQYGINLVANTSPATFGANPSQVPTSNFASGAASVNYNSANNYRYVNGEQIAAASQQSGETDYTISYIINVSKTTPSGLYTNNQSIVVVGTY